MTHPSNHPAPGPGPRAPAPGAFTLIEILISVAALALIAVGLAAVFNAIGKTVSAGKSVSAYTSYAALIERQMRADFARMTREFPLVIRNEVAGDLQAPQGTPLYPGDPKARPRRVDEIIFGIKAPLGTQREPLYPGFTARGEAGRVYYGHGQRRVPDLTPNGPYLFPTLDDSNADLKAGLGVNNNVNPNRYARDWTLVRHVTVFTGPATTDVNMPPGSLSDKYDNALQVGLQPAASSAFRVVALMVPQALPNNELVRKSVRPAFSSGLVDVATTDFSEIRMVATTLDGRPSDVKNAQDYYDLLAAGNGSFRTDGNNGITSLNRMQQWMDELFPTWSMASNPWDRVRIRYEPSPPDLLGAFAKKQNDEVERVWRRADQVMLASHAFLPRCSEFIVEWSFGKVHTPLNPSTPGWDKDKSGTPIWHGMTRAAGGKNVARPYDPADAQYGKTDEFFLPYRRLDGGGFQGFGEYLITRRRIHGPMQIGLPNTTPPLTSYFGYVDPQFNPNDPNGDGNTQDAAVNSFIPWAWPTLIRVTLSLTDPVDPTVEQTFQFVFNAPGNPAP